MLSSAQQVITDGLAAGLMPDDLLTVSEWADGHRELDSRGSPEPGRWRTKRVPYLREIMDNLSVTSPVQETVVMKGAQLGFTEAGNNFVGYVVHHAPGPGLFLEPSQDIANRNVRQKIDPMIMATPALAERVPSKRSKDGGNTLEEKEFPGGIWLFKWASSTAGLRSSSIRFLVLDEIDEYAAEIGEQGDPEMLARARTNAFGRRKKIYIPSTPTVDGISRISSLFADSDQRYFQMPCPQCDQPIRFVFKNLKWDKGRPETVHYVCQECSGEIQEWQKTRMLEEADRRSLDGSDVYGWVPQRPEVRHRRGYHINGLYAPVGFKSWEEIATEWESAQGNQGKLKGFVNTVLAETWKEKGEAPDWKRLYNRREEYALNVVPTGGLLLFAGVDVQRGSNGNGWLEVVIYAEGRNRRRWVIDHRQYQGDTSDDTSPDSPWRKIDEMLEEVWPHEQTGVCMQLSGLAVDSGDQTAVVYRWAQRHSMSRVRVVKGDTLSVMVSAAKAVQSDRNGKKSQRGVKLFMVGQNLIKAELYADLRRELPGPDEPMPPGYVHFPQLSDEFFQQLTGEQMIWKVVKGRSIASWEPTRLRVEVLDCTVYARAAAWLHGVDRYREEQWQAIEHSLGIDLVLADDDPQEKTETSSAPAGRERVKSSYWGGRR